MLYPLYSHAIMDLQSTLAHITTFDPQTICNHHLGGDYIFSLHRLESRVCEFMRDVKV